MFRPLARVPRRGVSILLVVVITIALFVVVGVTFVFLGTNTKKLSEHRLKAAATRPLAAPPPTDTVNRFLSAIVYGVGDDGTDVLNPLRGHSLAASMYGRLPGNVIPWNGVGTFHENTTYGDSPPHGRATDSGDLTPREHLP